MFDAENTLNDWEDQIAEHHRLLLLILLALCYPTSQQGFVTSKQLLQLLVLCLERLVLALHEHIILNRTYATVVDLTLPIELSACSVVVLSVGIKELSREVGAREIAEGGVVVTYEHTYIYVSSSCAGVDAQVCLRKR